MPSILAWLVTALAILYIATRSWLLYTQDPQEPPLLESGIPFVTPIIGIFRRKGRYFDHLRNRWHNPIYTLRYPGVRFYVVNSPNLITAVQRQAKALTFQAIENKISKYMVDISPTAVAIEQKELSDWLKSTSHASSPAHNIYRALNPGPHLDAMNRAAIDSLTALVDKLGDRADEEHGSCVKLFEWVTRDMVIATTDGVYGPENPYRDGKMRDAFWDFCDGLGTLAMGPAANLFASKSIQARVYLFSQFENYFKNNGHLQASGLVQQRYDWYIEHGYPVEDVYRFEAGNGLAILTNTVPTTFWVLVRILSRREVFNACHEEVLAHVSTSEDSDGTTVKTLDVGKLKTNCPILLAAFKETLRLHTTGIGARQVMEDHLLDGKYLLKKDALVLMPSTVQHWDSALWGQDVDDFDVSHFYEPPSRSTSSSTKRTKPNPVSFRSFGGGSTLCPGRHFATTEVLVLVAMLMLRFTITPVSGHWTVPKTEKASAMVIIPPPDEDVEVDIVRKEADEGVRWVWNLTGSNKPIEITAEDMSESMT